MTIVQITFPYSIAASKNALRGKGGGIGTHLGKKKGWVYLRPESKKLMENIHAQLQDTGPWYHNKVWLDVFVTMPTRTSDAINVLEVVADGVKTGIGIDDNWFCIERLDWSTDKHHPLVTVLVKQYEEWNAQVCSGCQVIKPASSAYFNKGTSPTGVRHTCRVCQKEGYDAKKKKLAG